LSKTATTLRVDYAGLKRRVEAAATVSDSRTPTENRFLELSPPQPPVQRQCVVQLEGSGGAKMRIELNGMETPDLLALSRGFWEVER
jgi:hypothetical protein